MVMEKIKPCPSEADLDAANAAHFEKEVAENKERLEDIQRRVTAIGEMIYLSSEARYSTHNIDLNDFKIVQRQHDWRGWKLNFEDTEPGDFRPGFDSLVEALDYIEKTYLNGE